MNCFNAFQKIIKPNRIGFKFIFHKIETYTPKDFVSKMPVFMLLTVCKTILFAQITTTLTSAIKHEIPTPDKDMDYERYANIVRNGLPQTTEPKTIVIVGAGMAGLSAGYVLKQAGHKVNHKFMIKSVTANTISTGI